MHTGLGILPVFNKNRADNTELVIEAPGQWGNGAIGIFFERFSTRDRMVISADAG
jgi:hypothetical protein